MRMIVTLPALTIMAMSGSALAEDAAHPPAASATPHTEAGGEAGDQPAHGPAKDGSAPSVRMPGFAAVLANRPEIEDVSGWPVLSDSLAWQAIGGSSPQSRQSARWNYARSLIGKGRAAEAYGVLVTMRQDDPDLSLVAAHRLAFGAVLVELGRYSDALDALSADQLGKNPEACAWRLRALAALEMSTEAGEEWSCARPAIASRNKQQGTPFLLAAAQAALHEESPDRAIDLLKSLSDSDAAANLIRGRAFFMLGSDQEARLRLDRAADNGTPEQRVDSQISLLEGLIRNRRSDPSEAAADLDRIGYSWRGDSLERRVLVLRFKLAEQLNDDRGALAAGAALMRYHRVGADTGEMLKALQDRLAAILAPESEVPLAEGAGLFWDYRDLSPTGTGGDFLVSRLADRLQEAGLYKRAAELLDYQLMARAKDVTQGPLSVRVAKLYILSGQPEKAIQALRATDDNVYPDDMRFARLRIEAVALHRLGRTNEALAVLDGVPNGDSIRNEIEWGRHNWLALSGSGDLPAVRGGPLTEVEQTVVLRRAVALAMLGEETSLENLRTRYERGFAKQPTAAAFQLLTGPVEGLDPEAVSKALAAMPTASPAGEFADLLAGDEQDAKDETKAKASTTKS